MSTVEKKEAEAGPGITKVSEASGNGNSLSLTSSKVCEASETVVFLKSCQSAINICKEVGGARRLRRLGALLCDAATHELKPTPSSRTLLPLVAMQRPSSVSTLGLAYLSLGETQLEERAQGLTDQGRPRASASDHTGPKFDTDVLVSLLRQENEKDICVIQVPPEMKYTEYFVIGSGTSTRHLNAMAIYIVKMYKYLKCKSHPHVKIEGKDTDDWLCIDFGNMVIHLMLPETREFYELEKLWTLRSYDDQLAQIAPETLPEDFILGREDDTSSLTPVEFKCE
ncbi:PREDICTED: mitochondrial assembly of ribosomal large subunit protein 1-like [Elephantulus edwardii]|uniref:mitochondrial assembly of ribosomal large subunit protein 1-like n=1 Tax=Elephantulus edwardii TaxID=28737 RepID=UPI0003F0EB96|nr:PREDICTED: mitochondrial assembly of ribosomal large subunit protein 1-like [Elephantulus edwardii]